MKVVRNLFDLKSAPDALIFFLLVALLVFAPLFFGGNHPLPLMVLELMALPLLAHAVWRPGFMKHLHKALLFALGLLALYPLLQWLPLLPNALWQALSGREIYATAVSELNPDAPALRAISLVPRATEDSWLALLPPLAVFLVAVGLREDGLKRLVYVFVGMAAFQAVLALTQFGGGLHTAFRLNPGDIGLAVGTYVNRNHLAGLLEMALPITLGLVAANIGRSKRDERYSGRDWARRAKQFFLHLPRPNLTMLFAALLVVVMLGIVFSRSRSGIMLGMIGIVLSALLFGKHIGGVRSNSMATVLAVLGLALASVIGLAPVMERFSVDDALTNARWTIYTTSMAALWDFFPFGSGLGTFADVYQRFQPDSISKFVNYTHNDYIQFVFEGGLPALVVLVIGIVIYVLRWPGLLREASWGTMSFMQVGAGISLLLMALHSLTDFNLHIPANAIYFALMAAVFFHRNEHPHVPRPARQEPVPEVKKAPAPTLPVPRTKGNNPFAD